jgi:hypothetical protein
MQHAARGGASQFLISISMTLARFHSAMIVNIFNIQNRNVANSAKVGDGNKNSNKVRSLQC